MICKGKDEGLEGETNHCLICWVLGVLCFELNGVNKNG